MQNTPVSPPAAARVKISDLLLAPVSLPPGLNDEARLSFVAGQIAAVRANLPLIFAANAAGLLFALWAFPASAGRNAWGAFLAVLLLASYLCLPRLRELSSSFAAPRLLRRTDVSAGLIALGWASVSVCGFALSPEEGPGLPAALLLTVLCPVAYGFASVPSAAILLLAIVLVGFSAPGLLALDGPNLGVMLAGASYVATILLLILANYRHLLDLAHREEQRRRYAEIVTLLMKDFDCGTKDWLWETEAEGRLVSATGALMQAVGCGFDQLKNKRLVEIGGLPEHLGPWQTIARLMSEHRDIVDVAAPVKLGNAKRWWQLTARPILASNGSFLGYRGVGRDVTEAHLARAELVQAKELAERASQAKSQFLNVLSHELRTPLNAIMGFSEIMSEEREGPLGTRSYKDYALSIVESSRQLHRIINDILDASRIDSGRFKLLEQEVDAAELAQVALRSCRELAARSNVKLTGDYRSIRAEIRGDLVRLRQILENLLTNSIKFTQALGTVDLKVENEPDGGLSFIVHDSGIGIEKKDLELVFEPFVQLDGGMSRHFPGTGLGLPIARRLARAHGGEITLTSVPGQGTTAIFRLPAERVIHATELPPVAGDVAAA